jgi:putative Mg2+ transporter-C (MgtC) family protein
MLVAYEPLIQLFVSVILGGIIGIEREKNHKPAGIRTHMLVCMGSCLFTIASLSFGSDPSKIAAGILTGIGFIGAGTIIAEKGDKIVGITTAASLWTTSAIGLLVGINDYVLAAFASILVIIILLFEHIIKKLIK